jgi:hypothetical protein
VRGRACGVVAAAGEEGGYEECEGEAKLHAVGFIVAPGESQGS